ncbi:IS200/IS605 family transposase [Staphylococcus intermedius]|uniref:IS200-like Y1_Tnp superfamily protein n=1 Tax=Staphylococcus intermedius NCTC 11048 TaxID=1141106 RepID=A0A380G819_STAIN|nr:IS200/IS605 family transposase [Staphylococcus intermedius]PNZ51730.1 IS200/IS605 family transposase [Staphylococcus intermedius NCTC 11048]PCF80659.1 IS200/IS605 family transposase [Staphylococcus intermedius]PCF82008.1 IS200/IS605 family transposase [Staphylococcus intermedius]PCF88344.1 IS200/IS605 family transposase [Staphylococcus intermedius]
MSNETRTKWNCNYHIVFAPKNRSLIISGILKRDIGLIQRQICERRDIEIKESEACKDYIHMLLCTPRKLSVSQFVVYLKWKSSLKFYDRYAHLKYKCRSGFDYALDMGNTLTLKVRYRLDCRNC